MNAGQDCLAFTDEEHTSGKRNLVLQKDDGNVIEWTRGYRESFKENINKKGTRINGVSN